MHTHIQPYYMICLASSFIKQNHDKICWWVMKWILHYLKCNTYDGLVYDRLETLVVVLWVM